MNKTSITKKIELFDADSLEYSGTIIVTGKEWQFKDCKNEDLVSMTSGMPLKAVLANLIIFNLVYDELLPSEDQ